MFKNIIACASLSFILSSCGVKGPELKSLDQSSDLMEPRFRTASFNSLLEGLGEEAKVFSGSLIVWNKDAKVSGISEVIRASDQSKSEEVLYKKSLREAKIIEVSLEKLSEQISKVESLLEDKKAQNLSGYLTELVSYSDQLKEVHKSIVKQSLQAEHKESFEVFCDAKFIDFLSSDAVLETEYKKRPVPFSLCENYYQEQGYFSSESCLAKPEGQNYLSCFWNPNFIKKSKLQLYKEVRGEKLSKESFDWEGFSDKWSQVDWKGYLSANRSSLSGGLLKFSNKDKLYLFFDKEQKKIKENLDPDLSIFFDTQVKVEELIKKRKNSRGLSYNHSDLLFNFPFVIDQYKKETYRLGEGYSQLALLSKEELETYGKVFVDLDTSELEESKILYELEKEKKKLEQQLLDLQTLVSVNEKKFFETKMATGKKLADENLAHSLWPKMEFKLSKNSEGQITLSWTLDQEIFTEEFSVGVVEKKFEESINNKAEMMSSFDREQGVFEFSLMGEALERMGWDIYEKNKGLRFNSLQLTDEGGVKMKFTLSYVYHSKTVPMFTGKTFIYDREGKELYQGSVLFTSF